MALDPTSTLVPGKGTVFLGPPNSVPFTRAQMALLDPAVPATFSGGSMPAWLSSGHTSSDNNVQMTKNGGDTTNLGSWWDPNLVTNRAATSWAITINQLQMDKLTFQTAFPAGRITSDGGYAVGSDPGSIEQALFVLMVNGNKRMGIYGPRVSLSIGDAPSIDEAKFFEIQLSGSMLSATTPIPATGTAILNVGDLLYIVPPIVLA